MSADVLRPLAAEAHRQGLKVWGHAATFSARPTDVVNAGADVVSHADLLAAELMSPTNGTPRMPDFSQFRADDPRITALLQLMAARGTQFDPTLYAFATSRNLPGDRGRALAAWCGDVVHRASAAGVSIVAGTDDLGSGPEGALPNIHEELRLLVDQAGLTPAAAIRAATEEAARAIGVEETRGTITTGKAADLVVLSADPIADIRHTRDVVDVFRAGRRYPRH